MFDNIGSKLKSLAMIVFGAIAVVSIIGGIIVMTMEGLFAIGLLICIAGPLSGWISVLMLYAFGELVENSTRTVELLETIARGKKFASADPSRSASAPQSARQEPKKAVRAPSIEKEVAAQATEVDPFIEELDDMLEKGEITQAEYDQTLKNYMASKLLV